MSDVEGTWDEGLAEAWREFRGELVRRITMLGWDSYLFVVVTAGYECDEMSGPELAVSRYGDLVRAAFMRSDDELLNCDGLYDMGFVYDGDGPLPELETDDPEWLAVGVVRALREVSGVVHPSFLSLWGPEPRPEHSLADEAIVYPDGRDELVEVVDATLGDVLKHLPAKDDDGDVPIVVGESVVYVRVQTDLPVVELFSDLVVDVDNQQAALFELNILNRDSSGPTFALRGDRVMVRHRLGGSPFQPDELRRAVRAMCAQVNLTAHDLIERVGGHTFLSEPPARPEVRRSPVREAIKTLRHLEDEEPGSVSPTLAAHIFHLDQKAILDQIARQRRDGRHDLVALLRKALRVVVERDAREMADQ